MSKWDLVPGDMGMITNDTNYMLSDMCFQPYFISFLTLQCDYYLLFYEDPERLSKQPKITLHISTDPRIELRSYWSSKPCSLYITLWPLKTMQIHLQDIQAILSLWCSSWATSWVPPCNSVRKHHREAPRSVLGNVSRGLPKLFSLAWGESVHKWFLVLQS